MNNHKLSHKIEEWLAEDRRAMGAAFYDGEEDEGEDQDLFDEVGLASHWELPTRKKVTKAYGMWSHYLMRKGRLDPNISPNARATKENLAGYVREQRARGVSSVTLAGNVRDLREALRVMEPFVVNEALTRAARTLARRAYPSRDQRHLLVSPSELFYAGLKRMKRLEVAAATDSIAGVKYADGAMMAIEAVKALRLRNLSGMLVKHNIGKNQADAYEVKFEAHETKTHVRIRAALASKLTKPLDYWFEIVRPKLLAGRASDAMWITSRGTDMAETTLYYRFCAATQKELKRRINPHLCRKIIVTGIAIAAPELVELCPGAVDHKGSRHTREAYDLADDLTANAVVNDIVGRRRAEAIKRLKS